MTVFGEYFTIFLRFLLLFITFYVLHKIDFVDLWNLLSFCALFKKTEIIVLVVSNDNLCNLF